MSLLTILEVLFFVWLLVVGYFYLNQAKFLFVPDENIKGTLRDCSIWEDYEVVNLEGTKLYIEPDSRNDILIFYHGNTGTVCNLTLIKDFFETLPYKLIFVEYRSYDDASLDPSEKELRGDVNRVVTWVEAQDFDKEAIVGWSLGTGLVAYHLNQSNTSDVAVLITPFTTLAQIVKDGYFFLPVKYILKHNFDNIAALQLTSVPILILGAENDKVIPVKQARELARRVDAEEYIEIEDTDHGSIIRSSIYKNAVKSFLATN